MGCDSRLQLSAPGLVGDLAFFFLRPNEKRLTEFSYERSLDGIWSPFSVNDTVIFVEVEPKYLPALCSKVC